MNYFFYHKDENYKEAFRKYYKKNMSQDVLISFEEKIKTHEIVICEKEDVIRFPEHDYLILSRKNLLSKNEICKYQDMKVFFDLLSKNEINETKEIEAEVYVIANGFGGSGSTTLSLNLAKTFSESISGITPPISPSQQLLCP